MWWLRSFFLFVFRLIILKKSPLKLWRKPSVRFITVVFVQHSSRLLWNCWIKRRCQNNVKYYLCLFSASKFILKSSYLFLNLWNVILIMLVNSFSEVNGTEWKASGNACHLLYFPYRQSCKCEIFKLHWVITYEVTWIFFYVWRFSGLQCIQKIGFKYTSWTLKN